MAVTITDTSLLGGGGSVAILTLSGVDVSSVSSSTATKIVVAVAAGWSASTGDVVIEADTGAPVKEANGWQQLQESAIAAVSP